MLGRGHLTRDAGQRSQRRNGSLKNGAEKGKRSGSRRDVSKKGCFSCCLKNLVREVGPARLKTPRPAWLETLRPAWLTQCSAELATVRKLMLPSGSSYAFSLSELSVAAFGSVSKARAL